MNNSAPQQFSEFVAALRTATYDQYKSFPDAAVSSEEAFEEMRAYLLEYYGDMVVQTSHRDDDGQIVDFVPTHSHPCVRRNGGPLYVTTPQPVPAGGAATEIAEKRPAAPESRVRSSILGRDAKLARPSDTVPLYRVTLEQLARFETLADFSAKKQAPPMAVLAGGTDFLPKRYATGEQDIRNAGGGSVVSVWTPVAAPGFQESYGQQWYLGGVNGTWLQTVECGWHVDLARYRDMNPHLFVYATRRNYDRGHSFFNFDGGAFVPVTGASVQPGVGLFSSQIGGADVAYRMGFWLVDGFWVFYFDGEPIGGYPLTWFTVDGQDGPMTSGADRIKFGGEVGNALPEWPAMGSSRKAHEGYGKAAYHRGAFVTGHDGVAQWTQLSEAGSVVGNCFSVDIHNTTDPDWGSYLFYGGRGGPGC